jgi:sec-independent protein translocase protein TatA
MPIGIPELLILLFVVLLVLGPKRLPALGRSLGGGMREFKDSIRGSKDRPELPVAETEPERDPRS